MSDGWDRTCAYCIDLQPSYASGLAVLCSTYGVDAKSHRVLEQWQCPHLEQSVPTWSGVIDRWPDYIGARVLTFYQRKGEPKDLAKARIQSLASEVKKALCEIAVAELETVEIEFGCSLQRSQKQWKIQTVMGIPWIKGIRDTLQHVLEESGFFVDDLQEERDQVHMVLRGPYETSEPKCLPQFGEESPLSVTFDKIGIRRAYPYGCGKSECLGSLLGPESLVREGAEATLNLGSHDEYPPLGS
mmetsp:Transcript_69769/g.130306  ORF Transcript_69769/g.130306 Transcript_69769/m.130306 type:complete len:244 (-) Transcript_69769:249-980(-)